MTIETWCHHAQKDQNTYRRDHCYANYRYCLRTNLLASSGVVAFGDVLKQIDDEGNDPFLGLDEGAADQAIDVAAARVMESPGALPDFRMTGPTITHESDRLFVNVRKFPHIGAIPRLTTDPATATGLGASSVEWEPPDLHVTWLTTFEAFRNLLELAVDQLGSKLGSIDELFSIAISGLGLGPRTETERSDQPYDCAITLWRTTDTGKGLHRPHAFSVATADRFCAHSRYKAFGQTIDNRSARPALPEAIAYTKEIVEIDPSEEDYLRLRDVVQQVCPDASAFSHGPVRAIVPRDRLWNASDADYQTVRNIVLGYLDEDDIGCDETGKPCLCRQHGLI